MDGEPWPDAFDMVWDPVFTPTGEHVLAKVERDGRYAVALNGVVWSPWFERLEPPTVSPDGRLVLVRWAAGDVFHRQVVAIGGSFDGGARV